MAGKFNLIILPFLFISCVTTNVDQTTVGDTGSESQVVKTEEEVMTDQKVVSGVEVKDGYSQLNPDYYFSNLLKNETVAFSELTHEIFEDMNPVSSNDQGMYKIYSFDVEDPNAVIAFGQDTLLVQSIDWIEISGSGFPSSLKIGMSMEEVVQSLSEVYGEPDYISDPGTRPLDYYGWSNISSNFVIGFLPDTNSLFSIEF